MDPEILAKLNEILTTIETTNTISIEQVDKLNNQITTSEATNVYLLDLVDKQNQEIFVLHSLTIGIAFISGFFMWYLMKKNFYNFGV